MPDDEDTTTQGGTPPAAPPPPAPPAPPARAVGHGGTDIPPERISELVARERRKFNKENFGTDDEDEVARIKQKNADRLKKAEELEAKQEEERLKGLSDKDRLTEELRVEREQRATEKSKLERERDVAKQALEVERQDVLISGLASKYVGPKFLKLAKVEFGEYVDGLTKAQLSSLDQGAIDKWFAKFVKENPEYKPVLSVVKTAEEIQADKDKAARPVVPPKRPLGAPARPGMGARPPVPKPATGKGTFNGKKIGDLNKAEMDAYYKSLGRRKPY